MIAGQLDVEHVLAAVNAAYRHAGALLVRPCRHFGYMVYQAAPELSCQYGLLVLEENAHAFMLQAVYHARAEIHDFLVFIGNV